MSHAASCAAWQVATCIFGLTVDMMAAGEVIDDKECARRMLEAKEKGEPHFYMMELGGGLIIDARDRGNVSRLINSSCCSNAESQKWHDAGTGPEAYLGTTCAR